MIAGCTLFGDDLALVRFALVHSLRDLGRMEVHSFTGFRDWARADGDVGIALASIADEPLSLTLPIDAKLDGATDRRAVYRIDHSGSTSRASLGPS